MATRTQPLWLSAAAKAKQALPLSQMAIQSRKARRYEGMADGAEARCGAGPAVSGAAAPLVSAEQAVSSRAAAIVRRISVLPVGGAPCGMFRGATGDWGR